MSTGLKLDPETQQRLKDLAAARERTPHWLMKKAIQEYLAREEAFEQEKAEDAARWQAWLDSGRSIAHDDVMSWLESIGTRQELPCPK